MQLLDLTVYSLQFSVAAEAAFEEQPPRFGSACHWMRLLNYFGLGSYQQLVWFSGAVAARDERRAAISISILMALQMSG